MRKFFLKFFLTFVAAIVFINLNPNKAYSFVDLFSNDTYPYLNDNRIVVFKKAYEDYLKGRYKSAAGQFWLYTLKGRSLKNYALYYQGLALFKLKEYLKAEYVFLKLAKDYPHFIFYKNAIFYLANSEEKSGSYYPEISHFKYIVKNTDKSAVRSYAFFKIYKAYLKLKDYRLARYYLLRLYVDYPYFSKKHNITFKNSQLDNSMKIKRALNLYYDSYYLKSLKLLKNISLKNKKARFITLKDLMKLKRPLFLKNADECLAKGGGNEDIKNYKNSYCYKYYGVRRLNILELKVYYYYHILHNDKKTMFIINQIAEKYGFLSKNIAFIYSQIVWNYTLKYLKEGNYISAAKTLNSFLTVNDDVNANNAKFLFWYGVMLKKLGYKNRASFYFHIILASRLLRYSYYGVMSEIMINKINGDYAIGYKFIKTDEKRNAALSYKDLTAFKKMLRTNLLFNLNFKRLKTFLNLKLYSLSDIEIDKLLSFMNYKNKRLFALLAYMLYKNGYYGASIYLTFKLIYDYGYRSLLLHKRFLKTLYPMPFRDNVEKYSRYYDVPASLIYGIMRQESLYNPACYSSADAIGLMQIIPSTGYYIARKTGCYSFNPSMLYRININISFGSYYLKTLLNRFYNRKYLAIASYNAGPGAVAYWKDNLLKDYKMPLFIELIPFNQTRNYVKKVLANYYVYNSIYNSK